MTKHLEGDAARADDDGRAYLRDRNRAGREHPSDLVAGGQVRRQGRVALVTQPSEEDDAADACIGGGVAEHFGRSPVPGTEVVVGAAHRVDEEVGGVDALGALRIDRASRTSPRTTYTRSRHGRPSSFLGFLARHMTW